MEPAKIHSLLVVALDANEQFKNRARCCSACAQRQVKGKDREGRTVELREAKNLSFTDPAIGSMRVVLAEERWPETRRVGGRKTLRDQHRSWRWLANRELDGYGKQVIWQIGHQRWGVENHGSPGELSSQSGRRTLNQDHSFGSPSKKWPELLLSPKSKPPCGISAFSTFSVASVGRIISLTCL